MGSLFQGFIDEAEETVQGIIDKTDVITPLLREVNKWFPPDLQSSKWYLIGGGLAVSTLPFDAARSVGSIAMGAGGLTYAVEAGYAPHFVAPWAKDPDPRVNREGAWAKDPEFLEAREDMMEQLGGSNMDDEGNFDFPAENGNNEPNVSQGLFQELGGYSVDANGDFDFPAEH